MAIVNPQNNEYVKVISVDPVNNQVQIETFENKAHRLTGSADFHKSVVGIVHAGDLPSRLLESADAEKSLKDNLVTTGYLALKNAPEYSNYTDDL